jgi:outer membrane murein-binding lipoprotein Lpp
MTKMILLVAGALLLAGCQSKPENNNASESASAETQTQETVSERRVVRERSEPARTEPAPAATQSLNDPARRLPQLTGQLQEDGYGLDMLIDGSSPAAFLSSLELIASDTSSSQYQRLNSSLRYLEAYLLGPRNLTEFYQRLDAMTGQEVIELAQQQRQR